MKNLLRYAAGALAGFLACMAALPFGDPDIRWQPAPTWFRNSGAVLHEDGTVSLLHVKPGPCEASEQARICAPAGDGLMVRNFTFLSKPDYVPVPVTR